MTPPRTWVMHDTRGFGSSEPSGSGYFRIILPCEQLAAHGWPVGWSCWLPPPEWGDADLFVAHRSDQPEFTSVWHEFRRTPGLKLVYEMDDDPFALDPVNWMARAYTAAEGERTLAAIRYFAGSADLVTVTTELLAQRFREFNPNVAVLPNFMPASLLQVQRPRHPRLTVGWAGAASHARDIAVIAQAWRDVVDETGCRGHFVGTDFRTITRYAGFDCAGWTADQQEYWKLIDFDIGLAPLSDHPFNLGKSPLKALEYAALGIPVIASDHPVYRAFVADGVTGFLCRTPDEWRDRMRLLLADEALRTSMGAKARELAADWTIERNWTRWADAYRSVTEGSR